MKDKDSDDIDTPDERKFAMRIVAAINHPDCPVILLEKEAKELAYHITKRIKRYPIKPVNSSMWAHRTTEIA